MQSPRLRILGLFAIVPLSLLAAGCATRPMGEPQPTMSNVQAAKAAAIVPANILAFKLAEGKDPKMDQSISVRATTLVAPSGSFAQHLQATLETELRGAGLLDKNSTASIEGLLTDCQLDPAMSQGTGRLASRIVVRRQGKIVYDKELAVDATWESSFVGAVAIPAAINEFTALFGKVVGKLLNDPDFRQALAR